MNQFILDRIEENLRATKVSFKLDGYDTDTVIMALKHYAKELRSDIEKLLKGDSIRVYSETVKRYYSAQFLADYLMEQSTKAIRKKRKEKLKELQDEKK